MFHVNEISIGVIMLVIPGAALTNAVRDMLVGHTISGLLRIVESLLLALMLAIGFGTVWAATSISSMVFGEGFRSAGRILLITTFSIILAQVPAVRKLRGNFDLGLFVAVLFLVTIGFAVDLKQFFGSTFYITLFCFCVIACSILLHLIITRLLKVRFEYVLLSIVGCISDGPTAALIASSAQWKTLINIGLLMGVLAGALGNYVGIGVAYAIRAFIGA